MSLEGTTVLPGPREEVDQSSEEDKMFSHEDMTRALAKQKEDHDASLEAFVQMRLATMVGMMSPTFDPRHHGASSIAGGRMEVCLCRISQDLVGDGLQCCLNPVFVHVLTSLILSVYVSFHRRWLLLCRVGPMGLSTRTS